jgi:O-antigen ligase
MVSDGFPMTRAVPSRQPGTQRRGMASTKALVPWLVFIIAHVALAAIMRALPAVGFIHAVACLGVGTIVAARRPLHQTIYIVGYIAGSEVLWRMVRAGVIWEYGKYACSVVLLIALTRMRVRENKRLALAYFGLLVPSAVLTIVSLPFDEARQQISFNLSGPLCLMLCVLFGSNLRITGDQLRKTLLITCAGIVAIAAIAYFSTMSAVDLEFNRQSNSITSGGFGPNQVSAMLGLACLFSLLLVLDRALSWRLKWVLLGIAIVFASQAALTFSRGGLALAFGGILAAILYLVRGRRTKVAIALTAVLLFTAGKYVVFPQLDEFTEGKLAERYTSTKTSHRATLAGFDLAIFADHPILGVGPGAASSIRGDLGRFGAAHTEFTRMLAEHGALGIISLLLLCVLAARTLLSTPTLGGRAVVAAMLAYFALFLLVNAMRLAAPAFVFGIACTVSYSSRIRVTAASSATGP